MSARDASVIVFDGVCNLCNSWVRFILTRDRARRYRFVSMQSLVGRRLLAEHGFDPDDPVSFLLLDNGLPSADSDAIIRVIASLGGIWRLAALGCAVPRGVRDRLYRVLARNRYRWFGRRSACMAPAPEFADRFLD